MQENFKYNSNISLSSKAKVYKKDITECEEIEEVNFLVPILVKFKSKDGGIYTVAGNIDYVNKKSYFDIENDDFNKKLFNFLNKQSAKEDTYALDEEQTRELMEEAERQYQENIKGAGNV